MKQIKGTAKSLLPLILVYTALCFCLTGCDGNYSYIEVLPPPGWIYAEAAGINNSGTIIGRISGPLINGKGFIFNDGEYTIVGPDGWDFLYLTDINNDGVVVGYGVNEIGEDRNFIYKDGEYTILTGPDGWGMENIKVRGINDDGVVVGDGGGKSFIYRDGVYTEIIPDGWQQGCFVVAINNKGVVLGTDMQTTGSAFFIYQDGEYTVVNRPYGWSTVTATGINDDGVVVGQGSIAGRKRGETGFIYRKGKYTFLAPFGWNHVTVAGINNNGVVVGRVLRYKPRLQKDFIYRGGVFTFFAPEQVNEPNAKGINDNGWVVGDGYWIEDQQQEQHPCYIAIPHNFQDE